MVYAGYSFANVFQYQPGDVYWCTADIGWITGHSYIVYGPMLNGATTGAVFEGVPTWPAPARFWEVCEKLQVNQFYTAPTAIRALMACPPSFAAGHDLSALKVIGSVGEPINEEAWQWYHDVIGGGRCALVDTWWQTETGGILISGLGAHNPMKPAGTGLPLPDGEPVLVDGDGHTLDGEAKSLPLHRARRWPSMIRTDLWRSRTLPQRLLPARSRASNFTGDGARRDADGMFRIIGRVDDVVNVSGQPLRHRRNRGRHRFAPRRGRERGHRLPAPPSRARRSTPTSSSRRAPCRIRPRASSPCARRSACRSTPKSATSPARIRIQFTPSTCPRRGRARSCRRILPQGGQRRTRPARRHLDAAGPDGRRRPGHRRRRIPRLTYLFAMRFQDLLMLAVVPAFLLVSCANDECCSAPGHDQAVHEGHDHDAVADDYHVTGNCAMEFTAADSARRAAKHAEPGVKMVELSSGHRVFTQTVGENPDVKILTLHGGPACTHEYMTAISNVLPEGQGYEVILYDQLGSLLQRPADRGPLDHRPLVRGGGRSAPGAGPRCVELLPAGQQLGRHSRQLEYALRHQDNLNGLIVCNMVTSIPEYAAYNEEVLRPADGPGGLWPELVAYRGGRGISRTRTSCKLVNDHFYAKHICRLEEWPEAITGSFERLNYKLYDPDAGPQ